VIPAGRRLRFVTLFLTALSGLVSGHLVGYALLAPGEAARDQLLSTSGHGYLTRLTTLAVGSAILAGLGSMMLGVLRRRAQLSHVSGVRWLAIRLIGLQAGGFIFLEILERALAGAPLSGLPAVLAIGVPVQALVAWIGAVLLAVIERAGEAIAAAFDRPLPRPRDRSRRPVPPNDRRPAGLPARRLRPIRAPPGPLLVRP
jgi:hypothetical protein